MECNVAFTFHACEMGKNKRKRNARKKIFFFTALSKVIIDLNYCESKTLLKEISHFLSIHSVEITGV